MCADGSGDFRVRPLENRRISLDHGLQHDAVRLHTSARNCPIWRKLPGNSSLPLPDIAPLDQTIVDLQAQIDRLSSALQQWRETQDNLQPTEARLTQITERFAEILNRWNETDRRHAQAIGDVEERVSEWGSIENR